MLTFDTSNTVVISPKPMDISQNPWVFEIDQSGIDEEV